MGFFIDFRRRRRRSAWTLIDAEMMSPVWVGGQPLQPDT